MWNVIKRLILFGPLFVAGLLLAAWLALPWPLGYRWKNPDATSVMRFRAQQAASQGAPLELRQEFVALKDIAPAMVRAVVAAEDGRFREHRGIDWIAIGEELRYEGEAPFRWTDPEDLAALASAGRYYWRHRHEVRGRSTITQQLAKNLYWTPERSLTRKLGEFVVAQRLEWFLDKDRILELYLNCAELGPGLFGVEAAAREYFGTSAAVLTPYQAASLAATLPHPLTSNPDRRPGRMAWRRDLILQRIQGGGRDLPPIPAAPEELTVEGVDPIAEVEPIDPADPPADTARPPDSTAVPDNVRDTVRDTVPRPDTTAPGRVGRRRGAAPGTLLAPLGVP